MQDKNAGTALLITDLENTIDVFRQSSLYDARKKEVVRFTVLLTVSAYSLINSSHKKAVFRAGFPFMNPETCYSLFIIQCTRISSRISTVTQQATAVFGRLALFQVRNTPTAKAAMPLKMELVA